MILINRIENIIFNSSYSNILGGLSPDLQSMEQIRRIMRPTDVPDQGLLCDLLWSDPDKVSSFYKKTSYMNKQSNPYDTFTDLM